MSEFGDRLKELLIHEGINPSRFADQIKVNRSGVSHIVNGRNKPGLDFIHKVRQAYPNWDHEWLVYGNRKRMEAPAAPKTSAESSQEESPEPLFAKKVVEEAAPAKKDLEPAKILAKAAKAKRNKDSAKPRLLRVLLFYEDGSFEAYENK